MVACLAGQGRADQRGRCRAVMVPAGPKIKADLSDPLWKRSSPLSLHPVPGKEGKLTTRVRVLFDAKNLYVAIECQEPDPKLHAKARKRDSAVWDDDCVELYFLPHPKVGYKQIAVNPLGAVFDQSFAPGGRGDKSWNARVQVDVLVQPGKGWNAVLSIPHRDLGAYAGKDQAWRFNVTRVRKGRGGAPSQEYSWALLPSADFHQPDAFGIIEHIDIPTQAGGVTRRIGEIRYGLQWKRFREARGVRRIFPHPLDPRIVWCATSAGLLVSDDAGETWSPVKSARADLLGEVTCLAVSPCDPDLLCMGTDARGLFLSADGGKTWKAPAASAERTASNHIEWVDFCPSDPTGRTLLATHGLSAGGISISRDLGATWEVFGKDRFLKRFVKQGQTLVAVGSMVVTDGKVWGIHRSGADGMRWEETLRNIRPAVPVTGHARWQFFVASLDGGLYHSLNDGKGWRRLVQSRGASWTSLFFTNGPTDETPLLAAYDPHRQGLCLSRHRFSNGLGQRQNRGLYVGPFVKSGATCVANANGTAYFVAMNNALWIGRWVLPTEGPAVVQARCEPCSVRTDDDAMRQAQDDVYAHIAAIAADGPADGHVRSIAAAARTLAESKDRMKFTVRARVRYPRGSGGIKQVTVNASTMGLRRATPMFDDGKHDDEKAGDGIYGAEVRFSPAIFQERDFRETRLLTVTAVGGSGLPDSWPAALRIPRGPRVVRLSGGGWDSERSEGPVSVRRVSGQGVFEKRATLLRFIVTGTDPWRAVWLMPGDGENSAGLKWLSFYIRGDTNQELLVHLVDHYRIGSEGFFDEPHFSAPAPLIAGGYLKAITPRYQKVRIPIDRLLPKGVFFLRWHTAGLGLSAPKGGKPGTYHVDRLQVEP
ncbi:MAG TPA: choice-of-anchor X domain-containing protein [Phycisphaerae bacterium]|nr:choice-of-anchor X domain-containing protein [Phycisphaerae bacterium]